MTKRTTMTFVCAGIALLLAAPPLSAHHAMVAEFNVSNPVTIKGTLTRMEWVNPHGWIYVDTKGADGRTQTWKFETGSPYRMEKRGLTKQDFRVGAEVIVSGFAAKDKSTSAAGMTITFLDRESSFPSQEATFILGR